MKNGPALSVVLAPGGTAMFWVTHPARRSLPAGRAKAAPDQNGKNNLQEKSARKIWETNYEKAHGRAVRAGLPRNRRAGADLQGLPGGGHQEMDHAIRAVPAH